MTRGRKKKLPEEKPEDLQELRPEEQPRIKEEVEELDMTFFQKTKYQVFDYFLGLLTLRHPRLGLGTLQHQEGLGQCSYWFVVVSPKFLLHGSGC